MKKTALKEIKGLENKELNKRIKEAKKELAGMVIEGDSRNSAKGAKDIKRVFKKRKDIAQMLTILRQKELLLEVESKVKSLQPKDEDKKEIETKEVKSEKMSKPEKKTEKAKTKKGSTKSK